MRDLIARLEAATGPDRELDDLIWQIADKAAWNVSPDGNNAPAYTASIDAALTLVPSPGTYVLSATQQCSWATVTVGTTSKAPTPALALCIAALRAREATNA